MLSVLETNRTCSSLLGEVIYLLCAAELLRAAVAVCLVKVFLQRIVPPVALGDNVNCYGRRVGKWASGQFEVVFF